VIKPFQYAAAIITLILVAHSAYYFFIAWNLKIPP
jgi:hypothetical protein